MAWLFEGPDLVVTAANRPARASVGDRPGIVGRPVREVIPEMEGQAIFDMIGQCLAQDRVVVGEERRALVDRRGDGTLEEGFFTFTFTPVHEPDGGVRGVVAHVLDVTAQARARREVEARAAESQARYQQAHDVVLTLQRSLLPASLPLLPLVELSARYLVAGDELAAGGDWFDAIPSQGRVTLVVGDVVGHGATAAAAMGQLRTVCGQALADGAGPEATVASLDTFAARTPAARGATVCLVELDTDTGHLRYVSRGHVPPLVVGADGRTRVLPGGGSPLGTGRADPQVHTDRVHPGELLLLYTDGLIERPGRTLADGLATLATVTTAAVTENTAPDATLPSALADRISLLVLERMGWLGYRDDVTVLLAHHRRTPLPRFSLRTPALPPSLSTLRRACAQWLDTIGADEDTRFAIQHALGEAATNAIEHAYPDTAGSVEVTATLGQDGTAELRISDHGRWRQPDPDPAGRGRGITLMRCLAEDLAIDATSAGTTIYLRFPVRRTAVVGNTARVVPGDTGRGDQFATTIHRSPRPRLDVTGPVDTTTAATLNKVVLDAARGGTLPVVLDLTRVTHLASAGVNLLHDLATHLTLTLIAPPTTPAGEIITLTGLNDLLDEDR